MGLKRPEKVSRDERLKLGHPDPGLITNRSKYGHLIQSWCLRRVLARKLHGIGWVGCIPYIFQTVLEEQEIWSHVPQSALFCLIRQLDMVPCPRRVKQSGKVWDSKKSVHLASMAFDQVDNDVRRNLWPFQDILVLVASDGTGNTAKTKIVTPRV